jgi:hypothetical protein
MNMLGSEYGVLLNRRELRQIVSDERADQARARQTSDGRLRSWQVFAMHIGRFCQRKGWHRALGRAHPLAEILPQ